MTRKTAIRLLAGFAGLFGPLVVRGRVEEQGWVIRLDWDRKPPPKDPLNLTDQGILVRQSGGFEFREVIPGTAIIKINLSELQAIEVTLDGQTRRITRKELWEAL